MKVCRKCNTEKPPLAFYKNNASKDKLTSSCRECSKISEGDYNKRNPMRKRNRNNKQMVDRNTGLPLTSCNYFAMLNSQDNKCGICYKELNSPYVDHDHKTGMVRMILCHHCNTLLGMSRDSISVLENAISYLQKFK